MTSSQVSTSSSASSSPGDDTFHVIRITGTLLKAPQIPAVEKPAVVVVVVVDCRFLAREKCIQNVSVISELLRNRDVAQIWFNRGSTVGSFLEIKERLKKSLKRDGEREEAIAKAISKVGQYNRLLF